MNAASATLRRPVRKVVSSVAAAGFLGAAALAPLSVSGAFAADGELLPAQAGAQQVTTASAAAGPTALQSVSAVAGESPGEGALYSLSDFLFKGVVNWGGYRFTFYSQNVLPGGGLLVPGRHVNEDGYVSDGDGYIVLAGSAPKGTIYETPFGYQGKIYDRGTFGNHLDVYIR